MNNEISAGTIDEQSTTDDNSTSASLEQNGLLAAAVESKALSIVGSSRNHGDRQADDFYPTPAYATEALLDKEIFEGNIWECACGEGDMSKVFLANGYAVYSSDLVNRGYGESIEDIANKLELKIVPIIGKGKLLEAVEFVKQGYKSTIAHNKDYMAEGLIMKPSVELFNRKGERIISKIKYKDFQR